MFVFIKNNPTFFFLIVPSFEKTKLLFSKKKGLCFASPGKWFPLLKTIEKYKVLSFLKKKDKKTRNSASFEKKTLRERKGKCCCGPRESGLGKVFLSVKTRVLPKDNESVCF